MKYSIALLALTFAFNASAGCPAVAPAGMPEVPDGAFASESTMRSSKDAVQEYVQTIESYLDCRRMVLSDARHNEIVEEAEKAAGAFNAQLQPYRARNGNLAKS